MPVRPLPNPSKKINENLKISIAKLAMTYGPLMLIAN
jgi:hypothetical protein